MGRSGGRLADRGSRAAGHGDPARAHEAGYAGGKSALYALIRRLRPTPTVPVVRFEGVPGEFSQHDFGQADVRYGDGRTERVHFFASRLKWSRAVDVRLVPNEQEEALVRALLHSFDAFGGIPLVTVWDNPKTVVQARQGDLIVWNAVFGQVALDYRFAPELCWPRAAQQKGAVEQLVGWVKRSFFACRRFHDRADLERQLTAWLLDVNTVRPSRATGVIPAVRLAEEQLRLRPLPIAPSAYALKIPVVVSAQGRVRHAGVEYSMPADTRGPEPYRQLQAVLATCCASCWALRLPIHDLRHTFASRLVARGVSSYIVQHAGGWRTASMMQRYAHLDPGTIRAAVELLALPDRPSQPRSGTDSATQAPQGNSRGVSRRA